MWQAPVASQQITSLMVAAMRSGMTWVDEQLPAATTTAGECVYAVGAGDGAYQRAPTPKKNIRMMVRTNSTELIEAPSAELHNSASLALRS